MKRLSGDRRSGDRWSSYWLAASLLIILAAQPAFGCVVPSNQSIQQFTDVTVEGKFVVVDQEAGKGFVMPERTVKGTRKTRYAIRWEANDEELNPEMAECMLKIPDSGHVGGYHLAQNGDGTFRLIGRYQRQESSR